MQHLITEEQLQNYQDAYKESIGGDFSEDNPRSFGFNVEEVKELVNEIQEGGKLLVMPVVVNGKNTVALRGVNGKQLTQTILEVAFPCPPICG